MTSKTPAPHTRRLQAAVLLVNIVALVLALLYTLPLIFGTSIVMSSDASFGAVILYYAGLLVGAVVVLPVTVVFDILYLKRNPTGWKKALALISLALSGAGILALLGMVLTSL